MFSPKNILVPTDFSEASDRALNQALDIAEQFHSRIYLLHVITESLQRCGEDYCLDESIIKQWETASLNAARERLQKEVEKLAASRKVDIVYDVKRGFPSEMILQEQEEKGIDLIVISSRGRTTFMNFLLGSVAKRVLRGAKCQVLLVKE